MGDSDLWRADGSFRGIQSSGSGGGGGRGPQFTRVIQATSCTVVHNVAVMALPLGLHAVFLWNERKWFRMTLYPDATSIPPNQTGQVLSVGHLRSFMTEEPTNASFLLHFGDAAVAEDMLWPATVCSELFFGACESSLTTEEDTMRGGATRPTTLVTLEFAPVNVRPTDLTTLLHSIVALVQKLGIGGDDTQRRVSGVHLHGVKLQLHSLEITTAVATLLTTLTDLGVDVLTLAVTLRESDVSLGRCSRLAQGRFFRAIARTRSSLEVLTVLGARMDVAQVAGLATALATTQTHVRTLELFAVFSDASSATRVVKWMWLAYALFSCDSTLVLDKLCLNSHHLRANDVAAMIAVLRSPDPVRELLSRAAALGASTRPDTEIRTVKLAKGSTLRLTPLDEGDDDWETDAFELQCDAQLTLLRTSDRDESAMGWTSVLVPGFGECWVEASEANRITTGRTTTRNRIGAASHNVTALAFAFDLGVDDDFVALRSLLRAIGGPVRSLELHQAAGLSFAILRDVLHACPRLENLYIEGVVLSDCDVAAFIGLYESRDCTVSSLTLEAYTISNRALQELANAVADPTSAIANVLIELYVGDAADDIPLDATTAQAFIDMLATHRTFLLLDLRLPASLQPRYQDDVRRYDGQYVPIEKAKLASSARLAFLSISTQPRFHTVLAVDSALLALIFDFAAEAFTRRVNVASNGLSWRRSTE